ncbi:toxin-antitoxin system YwqK family antitoxin [Parapedobacter sp. 10938]|uniref:toxin-antitoxin system YwqK family antitoxin n=1 Tax=Parapedobacter flavus TaxID=3110225 RepID=UPI002DB78E0A|nr:hypothetical protein [Parapedobacter sp. 10938]MEC3882000.1 hypothetical protein [Parapedobacter sp. 10938]
MTTSVPVIGQRHLREAIPYRNTATIRTTDGLQTVRFTVREYTGHSDPDLVYYSYYRDSIYQTQGGYHGQPLHGTYTERHSDGGLRVLGHYRYGIRQGRWQYWDKSGKLRRVSHWKNGKETGTYASYGIDGELRQLGYLCDGEFDGGIKSVNSDESETFIEIKYYNNGTEVDRAEVGFLKRFRFWLIQIKTAQKLSCKVKSSK